MASDQSGGIRTWWETSSAERRIASLLFGFGMLLGPNAARAQNFDCDHCKKQAAVYRQKVAEASACIRKYGGKNMDQVNYCRQIYQLYYDGAAKYDEEYNLCVQGKPSKYKVCTKSGAAGAGQAGGQPDGNGEAGQEGGEAQAGGSSDQDPLRAQAAALAQQHSEAVAKLRDATKDLDSARYKSSGNAARGEEIERVDLESLDPDSVDVAQLEHEAGIEDDSPAVLEFPGPEAPADAPQEVAAIQDDSPAVLEFPGPEEGTRPLDVDQQPAATPEQAVMAMLEDQSAATGSGSTTAATTPTEVLGEPLGESGDPDDGFGAGLASPADPNAGGSQEWVERGQALIDKTNVGEKAKEDSGEALRVGAGAMDSLDHAQPGGEKSAYQEHLEGIGEGDLKSVGKMIGGKPGEVIDTLEGYRDLGNNLTTSNKVRQAACRLKTAYQAEAGTLWKTVWNMSTGAYSDRASVRVIELNCDSENP